MACVYCFQVGSKDCFKVGRTKNSGAMRLKKVAVGSPEKLTLYREVQTQWPARLENHLHKSLAMYRAQNGEFFNVTKAHLDAAILEASEFIAESQPLLEQAQKLRRKKPTTTVLDPSESVLGLHRDLRKALQEASLLERKIELLQTQLQVAIGEHLGFSGVASWKWRETWRLNQTLLKREQPAIYARYRRLSGSRIFLLE